MVNRCTRWEVSLDAATAFERAEFEGIIFKNEYVFKSETLPEGCYLVEFKRRIGERITIPNLLKCLDAQFNKYIVEEWVPRAQSVLVQETGRVQRQRLDLGSPADELGIEAVMKELHRQVRSDQ